MPKVQNGDVRRGESPSRNSKHVERLRLHRELEYLRSVGDLFRRRRTRIKNARFRRMRIRVGERRRKIEELDR
jgi:hypothetical protein